MRFMIAGYSAAHCPTTKKVTLNRSRASCRPTITVINSIGVYFSEARNVEKVDRLTQHIDILPAERRGRLESSIDSQLLE